MAVSVEGLKFWGRGRGKYLIISKEMSDGSAAIKFLSKIHCYIINLIYIKNTLHRHTFVIAVNSV